MRQRIRWIDVLRGIGIISIVFSHTLQNVGITSKILYSFHVPLFFFVSGLLFSDGQTSFSKLLIKKAKRILVPYFLWGILSLALFLLLGKYAESVLNSGRVASGKSDLIDLLSGYCDGNTPLWFLPALFLSSVFLWIFDRIAGFIKNTVAKKVFMALPLALSVLSAYFCQSHGYNHEIWSIDDVQILFFFCWSGYLLKDAVLRIGMKPVYLLAIGLPVFAGACAMGAFLNGRILYLTGYYHSLPRFYLIASLAIFGLSAISMGVKSFRPLEYIGRNTLPILVMHKFPVLFFQCVCPVIKDYWEARSMPVMILITLLSVIMSLTAGEIIRRFLPIALGESKKR